MCVCVCVCQELARPDSQVNTRANQALESNQTLQHGQSGPRPQ